MKNNKNKMKKKEMARMKQLEAEWSSRESERHQAILDAQQRYELIENKLRQKRSNIAYNQKIRRKKGDRQTHTR